MIRALIPAAGRGSRSGLDFPKTLQKVDGSPILVRLIRSLAPVAPDATVIVSPDGHDAIEATLATHGINAELVIQPEPLGMGDAVGRFAASAFFDEADEILLAWGDMLALPTELARTVLERFRDDNVDMALPTHYRNPCYTHIMRNEEGQVTALLERRELGDCVPEAGEADCGLFVFRKGPVFDVLENHRSALTGKSTGETGFLAVIGVLAERGYRIGAYPIARGIDAASFNSPDDLVEYEKLSADAAEGREC